MRTCAYILWYGPNLVLSVNTKPFFTFCLKNPESRHPHLSHYVGIYSSNTRWDLESHRLSRCHTAVKSRPVSFIPHRLKGVSVSCGLHVCKSNTSIIIGRTGSRERHHQSMLLQVLHDLPNSPLHCRPWLSDGDTPSPKCHSAPFSIYILAIHHPPYQESEPRLRPHGILVPIQSRRFLQKSRQLVDMISIRRNVRSNWSTKCSCERGWGHKTYCRDRETVNKPLVHVA